ncbi:MAG TPA: hypothetical protein VEW07_04285 [Solirubrobacterales bacterium]|nr:hypothetical protein [Solirubrobacterales bacterium]
MGSAVAKGVVNPNELATTVRVEYIGEAAYQANLTAIPPRDGFTGAATAPVAGTAIGSGSADQAFSQSMSGLKANSSYRYRIVAVNSDPASPTAGPTRALRTDETGAVFALPDSRGWEMVSPVDKNGGVIAAPEGIFGGGVLQAAAQGGAVTYTSAASFGVPEGSPGASQYLARRATGGWATANLTVPQLSGGYDTSPGAGVPYQLFSGDLAGGLLSNGRRCRGEGEGCPVANPVLPGSGAAAGYRNYYLRDNGAGSFRALLTSAGIADLALGPEEFELALAGATPDLAQVVLSSCAALTSDAVEVPGLGGECDADEQNLYRWSGAGLSLVNLLPGATQGAPGAALAAPSGAVSTAGSRVYWTVAGNLYLREGGQTVQVDEAQGGGGSFQIASADGSVAFFTKAGHLYRYLATTGATTDLTPGGEVEGVLGASADGSHVYYLTAGGLVLWRNGATVAVAAAADPGNYPPATGSARVSADGSHLAFLSSADLIGYDSNGETEVFLYSTSGGLVCASCNPSGERPLGPATIPGAVANGDAFRAYKPRALSSDGSRLFFDSEDALVLQDTNADADVYQWEAPGTGSCVKPGGCINLISSGRSEGGARFVDAGADGSDVFFLTDGSLVPSDPGSVDLYDARVGGGFPVPQPPIPCIGDACQALPGEPEDPTPGTIFPGRANPPVSYAGAKKKKAAKKKAAKKKNGRKRAQRKRAQHAKRAGRRGSSR